MDEIIPPHRDLFDHLGITVSLEIYAHSHVPRDYHNIIPLMSLWNRDSHTFISCFHEFILTLLDVFMLIQLPLTGTEPLVVRDKDLSREEARVCFSCAKGKRVPLAEPLLGCLFPQKVPWRCSYSYCHLFSCMVGSVRIPFKLSDSKLRHFSLGLRYCLSFSMRYPLGTDSCVLGDALLATRWILIRLVSISWLLWSYVNGRHFSTPRVLLIVFSGYGPLS